MSERRSPRTPVGGAPRRTPVLVTAACALVLGCAPTPPVPASSPSPASTDTPAVALAWLVGTWIAETAEGRVTERWSTDATGALVGRSETRQGDEVVFFEQLRIEHDAAGVTTYLAQPLGRAPAVPFRAVPNAAPQTLVVENRAHDFPQRIEYRRDGDALTATISGPGRSARWDYRRAQ